MRIIKALIALVLLLGLFGITGIYSQVEDIGVVSTFFSDLMKQYPQLFYVYQGVLFTLLGIVFLLFVLTLFKAAPKKAIRIQREIGQANLSVATLEALAKVAIKENLGVDDTQVSIRLTKKQKAEIVVNMSGETLLVRTGQQVEQAVTEALQKSVQVETKKVTVIFKKNKNVALAALSKKEPRVI